MLALIAKINNNYDDIDSISYRRGGVYYNLSTVRPNYTVLNVKRTI